MKKLKSIVKRVLSDDPIASVLSGQGSDEKYDRAVRCYEELSQIKMIDINEKIKSRLKKHNDLHETLGTLLFVERLILAGHQFILNNQNPEISIPTHKQEKHAVAEKQFTAFYSQYLRTLTIRNRKIDWKACTVQQATKESLLAIQEITAILRFDFIITYCITHSKATELIGMIVRRALQRTCMDLGNLNRFIEKWSYLILESSPYADEINQVYEKLIFINKEIRKLEKIKNMLKEPLFFPSYKVNRELNMTIERELLVKTTERKVTQSLKVMPMKENDDLRFFRIEEEQCASIDHCNEDSQLGLGFEKFI